MFRGNLRGIRGGLIGGHGGGLKRGLQTGLGRGLAVNRALGIYQTLQKITQKQWLKDEYIFNIGSVMILLVLLTLYCLDLL